MCPVTIFHAEGETTVAVNQKGEPPIDGRFVALGRYRFEANGFGSVLVATKGTTGHVTADAVQFLFIDPAATTLATSQPPNPRNPSPESATAIHLKELEARAKQLQEALAQRPVYLAAVEVEKIEDAAIHIRGSARNPGPVVPRGFLQVATRGPQPTLPGDQSGRRELAQWIASEANPLTARVIVNRVWHWLFGAGLVRTTDNFGTTGETPSHPELLDHLAIQFVRDGWSVKRLVREILLSRTYQQAAEVAPKADAPPADQEDPRPGPSIRRTAFVGARNGGGSMRNVCAMPCSW